MTFALGSFDAPRTSESRPEPCDVGPQALATGRTDGALDRSLYQRRRRRHIRLPTSETSGRECPDQAPSAERTEDADSREHWQRPLGAWRCHENRLQEDADWGRLVLDEVRRCIGCRECEIGSFHRDPGPRREGATPAATATGAGDEDNVGPRWKLAKAPLGSTPGMPRNENVYLRRLSRPQQPPVVPPSGFSPHAPSSVQHGERPQSGDGPNDAVSRQNLDDIVDAPVVELGEPRSAQRSSSRSEAWFGPWDRALRGRAATNVLTFAPAPWEAE